MGTTRKDDEDDKDRGADAKRTRTNRSPLARPSGGPRPAGRVASSAGRAAGARPRIRATHGSTIGIDKGGIDKGGIDKGGADKRGIDKGGAERRGAAKAARGRPAPARSLATRAPKKPSWRAPEDRPQADAVRPEAPPASTKAPGSKRRSVAPPEPSSAAKEIALAVASAGLDKKALGIEVLDVTGRVDYADYLVIMTGSSDRHVHAIASGIDEELSKKNHKPLSVEGLGQGTWVLIDLDDVVVHVFQEETRRVYDIEGLWVDARRIEIAEPSRRP